MKNYFIAFAIVAIAFTGCKKDDDSDSATPAPAKTKTELLSGTWKMTSVTVNPGIDIGGGVVITDWYAQMEDCNKDDLTIFKTDGTGNDDEGAAKCDVDDPQTESFTWTFNTDETKVTIDYGDGNPSDFTIAELTASKLSATSVDEFDGVNYTFTFTFTHP